MSFPHPKVPGWREHRAVCLPDFQGVGLGNAFSEFIASVFVAGGDKFFSTSGNPAFIAHRLRSPLWRNCRRKGMVSPNNHGGLFHRKNIVSSFGRITAGFAYVGPPAPSETIAALREADGVRGSCLAPQIHQLVVRHPGATVPFLARRLSASDTTIRTSLAWLESRGRVQRHGAGGPADPVSWTALPPP